MFEISKHYSAGTGTCIDLSNPGGNVQELLCIIPEVIQLKEKLENHAVVLARIQLALASKRQMEPCSTIIVFA